MTPSQPPCCSCTPDTALTQSSRNSGISQPAVIRKTDSTITFANRVDHFLARWGVNRRGHRVEPGLYCLGSPTPESLVFASANYTLSFDALRTALKDSPGDER